MSAERPKMDQCQSSPRLTRFSTQQAFWYEEVRYPGLCPKQEDDWAKHMVYLCEVSPSGTSIFRIPAIFVKEPDMRVQVYKSLDKLTRSEATIVACENAKSCARTIRQPVAIQVRMIDL